MDDVHNSHRAFDFLARALLIAERQILVAQAVGTDFTYLPGGHARPGEGLERALIREFQEELGVHCMVGVYLGAVEYNWEDRHGAAHYEVNHVFEVRAPLTPAMRPESLESTFRFLWVPLADLETVDLRPAPLRGLIRRWAAGDASVWWTTNVTG